MTKFLVYTLSDPETKIIYHIGMGTKRRLKKTDPNERYGKCREWILSLRASGKRPVVDIIDSSNSRRVAFQLETKWIKFYREKGMPLTNETDGGLGVTGYKFSREHRQKLSARKMGNKNMAGKRHTTETKNKIREARKRQVVWNTGLSGIVGHNNKRVIDISTGVVFDSAKEAAEAFSINPKTLRGQLTGAHKPKTNLRYVD